MSGKGLQRETSPQATPSTSQQWPPVLKNVKVSGHSTSMVIGIDVTSAPLANFSLHHGSAAPPVDPAEWSSILSDSERTDLDLILQSDLQLDKLQTVRWSLQDRVAGAEFTQLVFPDNRYLECQHCIQKMAVWSYDVLDLLDLAHCRMFPAILT